MLPERINAKGRTEIRPKFCERCGAELHRRGWEKPHEHMARRFCGRTCSAKSRAIPIWDRFAAHTAKNAKTGCIEWTAYRDKKGYGRTGPIHNEVLAHRISWIANRGAIPNDLHVLHRCDNPACVNPDHLFLGTNDDNTADRMAKGRQARLKGSLNPKSKLTEADVLTIRADKTSSHAALGRKYGVVYTTIANVRAGRFWKHVADTQS